MEDGLPIHDFSVMRTKRASGSEQGWSGRGDSEDFIQTCLAKEIPVNPVFDMPQTLITKDILKEGGLGTHVPRNVLHGGQVEIHPGRPRQENPVTPVFDMPKTLNLKDVLKDGGLGIHVLKSVLHG